MRVTCVADYTCSDHGGHVQDSEGAVGRAAQVHVARQGQVPHLPVLPQAGQALRGQQVGHKQVYWRNREFMYEEPVEILHPS